MIVQALHKRRLCVCKRPSSASLRVRERTCKRKCTRLPGRPLITMSSTKRLTTKHDPDAPQALDHAAELVCRPSKHGPCSSSQAILKHPDSYYAQSNNRFGSFSERSYEAIDDLDSDAWSDALMPPKSYTERSAAIRARPYEQTSLRNWLKQKGFFTRARDCQHAKRYQIDFASYLKVSKAFTAPATVSMFDWPNHLKLRWSSSRKKRNKTSKARSTSCLLLFPAKWKRATVTSTYSAGITNCDGRMPPFWTRTRLFPYPI